jgi:outer membrane protein OmpA-like peptidoglycan-associated protein
MRILEQLNTILETQDTDRGLVATMADVLFDTGKYELRPVAREKLAKFSGIMLAYPGLNLTVEGHTDNTGSMDFNQKLSEQRANSVRQYLVEQGISAQRISAQGLGQSQPRAPNDSAANRQLNRRVELVIFGEVIGTKVGEGGSQ